jgi:outer membrane protein TolC
LTLGGVVDLALRNNPATLVSWTQARAAADLYGASRGSLYPFVSGSIGATRTRPVTTPGGVDRTQYGPSITLSYLVLDFGGRSGSIELARETAVAADYAHNVTVQNTILDAETAAFGYLSTLALRDAERAAIDEAAANLSAAEERHRVGLATIADVLQARTARAQEQLNLETLDGQVLVTRGGLAVAMGLPVTTPLDAPDISTPDSATVRALALTVDSILSLAVHNRPDLAAARADAGRAAAQLRVTRAFGLPAFSFTANGGSLGADVSNFRRSIRRAVRGGAGGRRECTHATHAAADRAAGVCVVLRIANSDRSRAQLGRLARERRRVGTGGAWPVYRRRWEYRRPADRAKHAGQRARAGRGSTMAMAGSAGTARA